MKKVSILLLMLIFVFSLQVSSSSANSDIESKVFEHELNEYQMIKELQAKQDNDLFLMGYTSDQIAQLKNLDYAAELRKRSSYDDVTLESMGYSAKQIDLLKNFKGTEEEIIILAASLSLTGYRNNFWYSSGNQYYKITFNWQWSSAPVWMMSDIIGIGWQTPYHLGSASKHRVHYKVMGAGSPNLPSEYNNGYQNYTVQGTQNAKHVFPMQQYKSWGPQTYTYWSYKGTGYVTVYRGGELPKCCYNSKIWSYSNKCNS